MTPGSTFVRMSASLPVKARKAPVRAWANALAALALVGLAFVAPANAQPREGHFRIGVLLAVASSTTPWMAVFIRELQKLGYVEGRNTVIEVRSAEGEMGRLPDLAKELVALGPDVIFAQNFLPVMALKATGSAIPVVFAGVGGDPVRSGLIQSLAHPGGNFTGMMVVMVDIAGKNLQLLKELIPGMTRAAVLTNPDNSGHLMYVEETARNSPALGIEVVKIEYRHGSDLPEAIERAERFGAQAVIATGEPVAAANRKTIIDLARSKRLPTMFNYPLAAVEGGLMAYGPDAESDFRGAAIYVDKILRGAKAADLPVQQTTRLHLVINLKTAEALGVKVPQALLARADEVIE